MTNHIVYITGASGFIGTHLIEKLKETNLTIFPVSRKKINFKNVIIVKKYEALNPKNSILVHLAEPNHIQVAELKGQDFIDANMKVLLELMKKKWKHIIYISTALINESHKFNNHSLSKKNNFYIKSKLECEKIVLKNNGTVLRVTNLYGPGMSKNNVFSEILKQLKNKEIVLKNIEAKRDFLWIGDAVDAISLAIKHKRKKIFYIVSNFRISIHDLVKIILKENGQKKKISGTNNCKDEIENKSMQRNWS